MSLDVSCISSQFAEETVRFNLVELGSSSYRFLEKSALAATNSDEKLFSVLVFCVDFCLLFEIRFNSAPNFAAEFRCH